MPTTMTVREAIRKLYPKLRRTNVVGIVHNTGTTRVYDCCHCGSGISMSSKWRMTVRVKKFIVDHNEKCGRELIELASK